MIYALSPQDKVTERTPICGFVQAGRSLSFFFISFCLPFFYFVTFLSLLCEDENAAAVYKRSDALPTVCSEIVSLGPRTPTGNSISIWKTVCVGVSVRVCVLQPQTNDVFDLLFVWKQRGACGHAPLGHTPNTHSLKKHSSDCEECIICVFDSCVHTRGLFIEMH